MDRAGRFRRSPHISRTRSKKATARSNKRPPRPACRSSSKNGFAIWSAAWERSGALCRTRKHATANWNNATRNCWRLRPLNRSAPQIGLGRIVGRLCQTPHLSNSGRARLCRAIEIRMGMNLENAAPQSVALPEKSSDAGRLNVGRLQQTLFAQARIFSAKRQQLLVGTAFDDATVIEYQNLIGMHNGREPVCDDDGGATKHQVFQCLLNQPLSRRIHAGGCFVQN